MDETAVRSLSLARPARPPPPRITRGAGEDAALISLAAANIIGRTCESRRWYGTLSWQWVENYKK